MARLIPIAIIAVVADALAKIDSHAGIDQTMVAAGIRLETPPIGSKPVKARSYLNHANNSCAEPLATLGQVIAELMESNNEFWKAEQQRIADKLRDYGLSYSKDGHISPLGSTSLSQTLDDIIKSRDLVGMQTEFDRIFETLETDPPAAVTASCALLEALFKKYIQANKLDMPSDQSLKPLWKIVKKDLKLDPEQVDNDDLKTILTGLAALVEGIGSLRTHQGSAHGRSKKYKLKPRHARLAAQGAFTLAVFVLESWGERTL